jgi:pyruvate,orthophosphate dikinase
MLIVLQALRMKGQAVPEALAQSLGIAGRDVMHVLQSARSRGWVTESKQNFRMTGAGREELRERLEVERAALDHDALRLIYEEFHSINPDFKRLVTDWQIRGAAPNAHDDGAYDAAIIQRLGTIESRLAPLLASLISLVPRLSHYPRRFDHALQRVVGGEHRWLARPNMDSYHTVWFELHEDLIGLLVLTREAEAARGRAE